MTDVKVEQCDKDAAHVLAGRLAMDLGISLTGDDVSILFYLSFARHRQAAEKAQQERDAGIAEDYDCDPDDSGWVTAGNIATAIRSQNDDR